MKKVKDEEAYNSQQFNVINTLLHASENLICNIISASFAVRSFAVKWQLIRGKLEQLQNGLTAVANCDDSRLNSVLSDLSISIKSTAEDAQVLAQRCSDESYSGGKLQLKSDLDVLAGKLELHIKNLSDMYTSGILSHSQSIIVSKPVVGASRDDMRFYVNDLVSRLRIGDSDMKVRALAALNEVIHEDEKYVRTIVCEVAETVGMLVSFLESRNGAVQEAAAEAVAVIAGFDSYKGSLVVAGVISPLIQLLDNGSELGKERAAQALKRLTENSDNAWSVSAQGGVSTLLKICSNSNSNSSSELIRSSCSILKSLSCVDEIKRFMVEEGAFSVFTKLLRSKEEMVKIQAIEFLTMLAFEEESIKEKVMGEGFVSLLVEILDPDSQHSSKAREVALRAIENFCFTSPKSVNLLVSSGFLNSILFFLKNGEISIQESTLKAVSHLCTLSEMTKKALGDAGFMPELMKLLEAKSFQVREMAAETLCSMISVQRNKKRFIQEEQNVNRILQLLQPEDQEKAATKRFLLSTLMSLTDSNSVRRKIVASGYVKYLEKLADNGATDAKKIVKKLYSKNFRSILTGLWN